MGRQVIPIGNLDRRLPVLGRIRLGIKVAAKSKAGKDYERPQSIDTFRFTSHDRTALEQVAEMYGGVVKEWKEPRADPGQFELITTASEIRVVLPPEPLGSTPVYEHWTGGGCDRRCDGVNCTRIVKGPDGAEQVEIPCLCDQEGALLCDPHTRLSVIIPEVRFGGVWRLDTKGWDAAQELPGMVALLESMQDRGLTVGLLRLEQRHKVTAGETHNFPVPVLALDASMNELAAGAARYAVTAGSTAPALGAGSSEGDAVATEPSGSDGAVGNGSGHPSDDEDIVDAEVVDDRTLADVLPAGTTPAQALLAARKLAERQGIALPSKLDEVTDYRLIAAVLDELGLVPG